MSWTRVHCRRQRSDVHIVNIRILLAVFIQHYILTGLLIVRVIDFEYGIFYIMFYIASLSEHVACNIALGTAVQPINISVSGTK